ncbi:MAG TPA: serine/threonine-protein kinase [Ktedonosporobacter sp.]|jgi:hypothetical protein|nr:serine/threonine-protein kinase [Ktedonosporobacter sp.]
MMHIETHDILFSLNQPEDARHALLTLLQQVLNQARGSGRETPDYRNILVIDAQEQQALFLAHLLSGAGYRSMTMGTALEAFTYFLRNPYIPFAVILGQEDTSNRLFLQRLLQQIYQKYNWDVPLIKLRSPTPPERQFPGMSFPEQPQSVGGWPPSPAPNTFVPPPSGPRTPFPPSGGLNTTAPQSPSPSTSSGIYHTSIAQTPTPILTSRTALPPAYQQRVDEKKSDVVRISLEGQNLGRYHIQSKIGDSAHSNVYQTYDRLREQQIALKALQTNSIPYHVLDASLDETNFFQQEVDLVHSLNHAHILPLWNSGKSYVSGNPFVYKTMPYYEEGSLADWLHKFGGGKPFVPREVSYIISQLADALQYVHDRQVTYQNIKLSNIIIRDKVKNMRDMHVLLADFAISQDGTFFSRTHEAYPYMAPERWHSQAFPASDQYGLAVIAYELLAGRPPFQGNAEHIMKRLHINMQPQPPSTFNPALSPAVNNVLLRALAKRPEDRFASIADFANMLQRYCP